MAEHTEWTGNNNSKAFHAAIASAELALFQASAVNARISEDRARTIVATLAWKYGVAPHPENGDRLTEVSAFSTNEDLVHEVGSIIIGGADALLHSRDQANAAARMVLHHLATDQRFDLPQIESL